jgi:hypothetical protein
VDESSVTLKELINERHEVVVSRLDELIRRVTETNGRVRILEVKVVVLQIGYAIGTFLAAGWFMEWFKR